MRDSEIIDGLPFPDYLAADAVSKSSLWTLHTKSPAHARVEKEPSNAMVMGTAVHCAVLEPDEFTERYVRGPVKEGGEPVSKNTNVWKEFVEEMGERALAAPDYDAAMEIRDRLALHPSIRKVLGEGSIREISCFWDDPATGLRCRSRPDAWIPSREVMLDLKTTADVRPWHFGRRVTDLGYHAQEAHYTDGWRACGQDLRAFIFLAVELKPPFAFKLYDLDANAVAEGRAIIRKSLDRWAYCRDRGEWPAYDTDPETLDIRRWAYAETQPEGEAA